MEATFSRYLPPTIAPVQLRVDFTNKAPDEVFKLGTLTYTNGTSFTNTLAFGITLSIGVANANVTIDPAAAQLSILQLSAESIFRR